MTYTLIDSVTLTSSASSVTFSGIPQTYGDLVLTVLAAGSGDMPAGLQFNGATSGYALVSMAGTGSSTSSFSSSTLGALQAGVFVSSQGVYPMLSVFNIMDYTATDKHKTVLARGGQTGGSSVFGAEAVAGRYPSTSAITSMTITGLGAGTYNVGSTFYLYGIEK